MINSKEMKLVLLIVLWACLNLSGAHAFEVTTHGAITQKAWARFLAVDPDVLKRLGIRDTDDAFNTASYYDFRPTDGGNPLTRNALDFEGQKIKENLGGQPFSVSGWLMRGAIREDDDAASDDPSPKEDLNGDFHRVFSHFYDPVNNRGLTGLGRTLGATAADWALIPDAVTPAFPPFYIPKVDPTPQRFNNFNLATFHESLWRATTGLNQAGVQVAYTADDRNIYWATAFRSLGDILHLNQDMAQPQHTRNDSHAGAALTVLTGHKSVFERYVDARVTGILGFSTKDDNTSTANVAIGPQPVNFGNYPIPRFPRYADYWANSGQKGLANYSNSGFFSIGTLPGNSNYASPSTNIGAYPKKSETVTRWDGQLVLGGLLTSTLYIGSVFDNNEPVLGVATNVPLFAKSAWDEAAQGVSQVYAGITLTKSTYDAAMDLLLPRAVAYSAGLLQYAFRGSMEITPPAEQVYGIVDHSTIRQTDPLSGFEGFRTIKLKVRNTTPGGEAMTGGKLVAVAKFHRNGCYKDDLSGEFTQDAAGNLITPCPDYRTNIEEIVISTSVMDAAGTVLDTVSLDASTARQLTFTFANAIPINATDLFLQVVYRGTLGDEMDAVVVATKDLFEPTYLALLNATDQFLFNGRFVPTTDPVLLPIFDGNKDGVLDVAYQPTTLGINFGFQDSFAGAALGYINYLPPARFSRLALLTDRSPFNAPLSAFGLQSGSGFESVGIYGFGAQTNQVEPESGIFRVSPVEKVRGISGYYVLPFYYYYGTPSTGDVKTMPPLVDKTPFPVTSLTFR